MKPQTYQHGEIRDENDNIIQAGTFGKHTAFVSADNMGILDYIINDLEWLYANRGTGGSGGDVDLSDYLTKEIAANTYLPKTAKASAAETADKVAHTLTISGVTFDGSADKTVNPVLTVNGTVPDSNGNITVAGGGQTVDTSKFVTTDTAQTITGSKTFGDVHVSGKLYLSDGSYLYVKA